MLSELPQVADIVRSVFHYSASPLVLRITAFGSEQFHGELWPNNATRLSRIDWLWSAKRASVGHGGTAAGSNRDTHSCASISSAATGSRCAARRRRHSMTARLPSPRMRSCSLPPLSAKRLLALWNALPGVEKRKKVGDRDALIDQLWSAIELLPV